jgi:diadenosine tetraphosphate (Ap4A) HIT family hydrolase
VFCALEGSGRVLLENELALCIADAYPVTPGHNLVIPRRHVADGLALHQPEWNAVVELLKRRREQLSWEAIGVGRGMNKLPFSTDITVIRSQFK